MEDHTIWETCPHCENEIEMQWRVEKLGYKAYCPVCGKRLMLCDECLRSEDSYCDFDTKTDTCKYNKKGDDI